MPRIDAAVLPATVTPSHSPACIRSCVIFAGSVSFQRAARSSSCDAGTPAIRYAPWATRTSLPASHALAIALRGMPRRSACAVVKTPSEAESSSIAEVWRFLFMFQLYRNTILLQHLLT